MINSLFLPVLYKPISVIGTGRKKKPILRYIYEDNKWYKVYKFNKRLRELGINPRDWYDRWVLGITVPSERPKCIHCGKELPFIGLFQGYWKSFCCKKCHDDYQLGKPLPEEHANKLREVKRSLKDRLRNSLSHIGFKASEETKKKLSEERQKRWENPTPGMLKSLECMTRNSWGRKSHVYLNGEIMYFDSSYELKFFNIIIRNEFVTSIKRESRIINYIDPIDKRLHRYMIDFEVKMNGITYLVEVKPEYRMNDLKTLSKINAAVKYCKDNNFIYVTVNEKFLNGDDSNWVEYNIIDNKNYGNQ